MGTSGSVLDGRGRSSDGDLAKAPDADANGRRKGASRRTIRRSLPLPGSRAVIGGLLVTAAAVGTFVAATGSHTPATAFVVAARPLAVGDVLGASDVRLAVGDVPDDVAATLLRQPGDLVGAVVRIPVDAGAPLTASLVEGAGSDAITRYRELSITVPSGRALDGRIRAGDRLDVLATTDRETTVVVQQVTVIAVDDGDAGGLVDRGDIVVTLALERGDDLLAVAHGAAKGELSLARSNRATDRLPARFVPIPPPVGATTATAATAPGASR